MKCDFFVFNHAKVEKKTIPLYNIAKKIPLYFDLYVLRRFFWIIVAVWEKIPIFAKK